MQKKKAHESRRMKLVKGIVNHQTPGGSDLKVDFINQFKVIRKDFIKLKIDFITAFDMVKNLFNFQKGKEVSGQ